MRAFDSRSSDATAALASTTGTEDQLASAATQAGVVETKSLRTQTSRTFATPTGESETIIGQGALNYRDASGDWAAINDSLVSDSTSGFAWRNAADAYSVEFPANLAAGPIKVSVDGHWFAFKVNGASSSAGTVTDDTVTYPNALPGVDITYVATTEGVRETLTLASASAASTYSYAVTTSDGVTAALDSLGVNLLSGGKSLARFAPPWATDASLASTPLTSVLDTTLKTVTGGYTLGVVLDPLWLANSSRTFPVTVDPTVILQTIGATAISQYCPIQKGNPTASQCQYGYSIVGVSTGPSGTWRSLAQFNLSNIPNTAYIQSADYAIYPRSLTTSSITVDAHQNAQKWNQAAASWNNADTGVAWTSGGGGTPTPSNIFETTIASGATSYQHFYLTPLVQGWVDQSVTNYGLLLQAQTENTSSGVLTFYDPSSGPNKPYLNVYWSARIGDDKMHTLLKRNLSDRTTLAVDPGDGNLLLSTTDMTATGAGPGSQLKFAHYYNSGDAYQASQNSSGTTTSQLGVGWITDNSLDASVKLWDTSNGGAATVRMPGGVLREFTLASAGGNWQAPKGMDADFSHDNVADTSTLVDHKSGLKYTFTDNGANPTTGYLTSIETTVKNTITLTQTSSTNEQITDTKGNHFNETLGSAISGGPSVIKKITDTDGSGRYVTFGYNGTTGQLSSYTDATGAKTNYYYDATTGMLNEIKDVTSGNDTTISYYTSGGYLGFVQSITQTTTDCLHSSASHTYITTYNYGTPSGGPSSAVGETDVLQSDGTDLGNLTTKYYWDNQGRVVRTIDPAGHQQDNTYDATTGQIKTFTDNVTTGVTTINYNADSTVHDATEPKPDATHTGAKSTVNTRAIIDPSNSGYQGPAALPTQTTDAQGNQTNYKIPAVGSAYGGLDLVTQVSQDTVGAGTATQKLAYNLIAGDPRNGTVSSVTNSDGNVTNYTYDPATGDLTVITPPTPQHATTFTYDSDNRVKTVTDGNGHTTTYSYDANDRPTKALYSDGTYIQYWYDTLGNLVKRHDRDYTGTTVDTITYDGLNRPTAQTYRGESQAFCYNAYNQLKSLTNGGGTVNYSYNSTGFLKTITEPGGTGCTSYNTTSALPPAGSRCIAIAMNGNNKPTAVAFPGGVVRTIYYTDSGKIKYDTTYQGTTAYLALLPSWNDPVTGNETDLLQTRQDTLPTNNTTTQYSYDGLNRLKEADNVINNTGNSGYTATTRDETYTYDTEGNRTKTVIGGTSTYYAYDADDQLCYSGTNTTPSCSTTGGTTYAADTAGNLISSSANSSTVFSASYDAANVTTSMNNIDSGGTGINATYPDYGQEPRATFGDYTFTNAILGLASSTTTSATTNQRIDFTRMPDGTILSMRIGPNSGSYNPNTTTNSYYSLLDQQNSVLGLTDATGIVTARYTYSPWGSELANTTGGSSGSGTSTTTNNLNHIRWLATYSDPEAGLYKFGVRYYSPRLGRFLQTDPKSHAYDLTQQDVYSYAGDAPTFRTDPSGADLFGTIVGVTLGAVAIGIGVASFAFGVGELEAGAAAVAAGESGTGDFISGFAAIGAGGVVGGGGGFAGYETATASALP